MGNRNYLIRLNSLNIRKEFGKDPLEMFPVVKVLQSDLNEFEPNFSF